MKKRAQSIVEYTLILGVVLGIIAVVIFRESGIRHQVNQTYNRMGEIIGNVTNNLTTQVFGLGN